jgi:hypothetical protein
MPEDLFENLNDGTAFDLDDFFTRGVKGYRSVFAKKVSLIMKIPKIRCL